MLPAHTLGLLVTLFRLTQPAAAPPCTLHHVETRYLYAQKFLPAAQHILQKSSCPNATIQIFGNITTSHTLVLWSDASTYQTLYQIVAQTDRKPAMIQVEMSIYRIDYDALARQGVALEVTQPLPGSSLPTGHLALLAGAHLSGSLPTSLLKIQPLPVILKTLEHYGFAKVMSRPPLSTTEDRPAEDHPAESEIGDAVHLPGTNSVAKLGLVTHISSHVIRDSLLATNISLVYRNGSIDRKGILHTSEQSAQSSLSVPSGTPIVISGLTDTAVTETRVLRLLPTRLLPTGHRQTTYELLFLITPTLRTD